MNLNKTKFFIGILILLAYVGIGVFGLFTPSHMSEILMTNCPYTEGGFSVCENNFDHISSWQQFSDVVFPSLFIFSLLMLWTVLYFLDKQSLFNFLLRSFNRWKYYLDNKIFYSFRNKIVKWLSLFENSPSFLYVRHI